MLEMMPSKRLRLLLPLVVIFFVSFTISFLELLHDVAARSYMSAPIPALLFPFPEQQQALPAAMASSASSSTRGNHINETTEGDGDDNASPPPTAAVALVDNSIMTEKELALLRGVVSRRAPCNLLFFGLTPQLLSAALLNAAAGGTTVFLEDDPARAQAPRPQLASVRVYQVQHRAAAGKAFDMLRRARGDTSCMPSPGTSSTLALRGSGCPLALKDLPEIVYGRRWDVVVVDGPRGDRPEVPGRMAAIYSAAVMARAVASEGTVVDVLVHDVRRTVEKWYSWEYLCDDNLVRTKGNLWHFKIRPQSRNSNSTGRFCGETKIQIV